MLPMIKSNNGDSPLFVSVPSFQALLQNVEASWIQERPQLNTERLLPTATPTTTAETGTATISNVHVPSTSDQLERHTHHPVKENADALSASSSGSTDITMYRKSPSGSLEDERAAHSVDNTIPASVHTTPVASSSSSRRNYWDIVLEPKVKTTSTKMQPLDQKSEKIQEDIPSPSKPFVCPTCSLRFRKRCNLITHISNVHKKIRPFYCSMCLRRFARKSNCAKHVSFIFLFRFALFFSFRLCY